MNEDKCPVCGSEDYLDVDIRDEILHQYWARILGYCYFTLNCCLNCGSAYVPKYKLELLRKYYHDQT